MGRQRLPRLHLLLIVALALLVFSASLTWTQEKSSARKSQTQLPDLAAQFAAAPETNIRFHPASGNLALTFAPNPGEAPSQVKFRSDNIGYHLSLTQNNALPNLWQIAKRDEMQAKANHFIGNTPNEWFTDLITHNKVNFRTPDPGGDVAYYGHRIPW